MGEISLLTLPPRGLRPLVGVGAGFDDRGDPRAEVGLELLGGRLGVLDRVVEQPGDGYVLVAARLEVIVQRNTKPSAL
jgi:hypothetical protein